MLGRGDDGARLVLSAAGVSMPSARVLGAGGSGSGAGWSGVGLGDARPKLIELDWTGAESSGVLEAAAAGAARTATTVRRRSRPWKT